MTRAPASPGRAAREATRAPRRRYHHGDLRRALVDAAIVALERDPAAELSLRSLAREAGVSPRAPYRHFATREALLAAVAVEGFATFMAALEVRLEAAGRSPIARLRAVAEAYVVFAVERPGTFRVMHAPYALVEETAPELVGARAASHARSMAIIAEGQAAGVLRSGDPMHLALACWASMHGVAVLLIEGQLGRFDRAVDAEGIARLVSGLVVEGVATRG